MQNNIAFVKNIKAQQRPKTDVNKRENHNNCFLSYAHIKIPQAQTTLSVTGAHMQNNVNNNEEIQISLFSFQIRVTATVKVSRCYKGLRFVVFWSIFHNTSYQFQFSVYPAVIVHIIAYEQTAWKICRQRSRLQAESSVCYCRMSYSISFIKNYSFNVMCINTLTV